MTPGCRIGVLVAAAPLLGGLAGCSGGGGHEVSMARGHRFDPETIAVAVGETVTWTSDSGDAHTVTAAGPLPPGASFFSSGGFPSATEARAHLGDALLTKGETYRVTFDVAGTYDYVCIPHEADGMRGRVVVGERR